jgi:hypothetical protein
MKYSVERDQSLVRTKKSSPKKKKVNLPQWDEVFEFVKVEIKAALFYSWKIIGFAFSPEPIGSDTDLGDSRFQRCLWPRIV